MIRLRSCMVSHILSPPSTSPISHLCRLLSASAPPISPNPGFAVKDYLVDTCGLTQTQALKASKRIPHLKSSCSSYLLGSDLEGTVKPNVAFLLECGLPVCDIVKLCTLVPRMLTAKPERLREIVACAEGLGVPRGSGMFGLAVQAVSFLNKEKIATKLEVLKKVFGWSDAQVSHAVSKAPVLLRKPEEALRRRSEFLISTVGLEPAYIAHRPVILCYSMEGRLRPRYYVLKFLKANGLLDQSRDYYTAITQSEMAFVEKFICPHKEAAPDLAEDYATICKGELPPNFRFT